MGNFLRFQIPLLATLVFASPAVAFDPPSSFTYQGRIFQANGKDGVESSSVVFKVQIYSPDGSCLLFEESHPRDMTGTAGIFTLFVGEGANTSVTALTLPQVFNNTLTKSGAIGCVYIPVSGDTRKIRLSYNDNGTAVTLASDQSVHSVPYALNTMALEGLSKSQFIQVTAQTTQVKLDTLLTNYTNLISLASGTGVAVPDVPAAGGSAVNKNYSDANIGGKPVDLSSVGNGQTIVWNSAQNKWQTGAAASGTMTSITAGAGLTGGTITSTGTIALSNVGTAGTYAKVTTDAQGRVTSGAGLAAADVTTALTYSPLNKAGDTMSGDLALATHNLVNSGYITMAQGKYLGLGTFDSASEATLITATLTPGGASYAGATWYNSTAKVIKYWDGTQAASLNTVSVSSAVQSFNGQTGTAQTLALGSSGTAPAWSSASNAHTLNLPLSSTTSVTAGLLSNADYVLFAAKQTALGFTPLDRAGSNAMAANLSMSPDGGTTLYKILNLKDPTLAQDAATKNYVDASVGAAGTIKSVALSAPSIFTVSGSPITSSGTLSFSLASQSANTVFAGPTSGSAAPTFRALGINDVRSSVTGTFLSGSACTAGQALIYSSLTDSMSCGSISISSGQVTTALGFTPLDRAGASAMSANLNMSPDGGTTLNKIINLKDPTLAQDAVTKHYVDAIASAAGTVTAVSVSAPLTISNASTTPAIALQAGSSSGQSLIWNGSAWAPAFGNVSQLRGVGSAQQFPTTCTSAQTLVYQAASDTFACANVAVASSQVSGLGAASLLNVGVAAGTVAAGNDSRITGAVQSAATIAGDLSGTYAAPVVAKIQSVAVSTTAPSNGQTLVFNSTSSSWEPTTVAAAGPSGITALTGDVTASGSGSAAAAVASVGGSSAVNVHAAELIANASASANTASAVIRRDGSGSFSAGSASLSASVYRDSSTNTATIQAPSTIATSYSLRLPSSLGTNGQILATDASGNLSWMSAATALPPNGSASGDLSGSYPSPTVAKIQGVAVNATTPTGSQFLVYNGTTQYVPVSMSGDATISTAGVLALKSTGTAGTYGKVTTDAQGRVTSGAALSSTDVVTALGFTPIDRAGSNAMSASLNMSPDSGTTLNKIINLKDPTLAQDAATKTYVDSSVGAAGTVKSVALSAPSIFSVSGSPITSSGTLSFSLASQSANTVFAGPTSGSAAPAFRALGINDVRSSVTGTFLTGSACASGQALVYSSVTDTMACATLSIASSQVTGLGGAALLNVGTAASTVAAGNDSRITGALQSASSAGGDLSGTNASPTVAKIRNIAVSSTAPTSAQFLVYDGSTQYAAVSMSGDATMSVAGVLALKSTGTAGTYGKVTTDAQGRVTSGAALSSADVVTALGFTPKTGTVTSLTAGTGLTGGTVTTTGTIAVDTGTTAGKIVALDGSAKLPAVDGSQLTNVVMPPFSNMVVLSTTGSSTWTVPAGVSKVYVQMWGGGGGAGGGTNSGIAGGGGGAGGYGAAFLAVTPAASVSVTVGTGGTGGGSGAAGVAGGSTTFASTTATGGSAGVNASIAPVAGGSSTATLNMNGGSGSAASAYGTTSLGGTGGSASGGGGAGGGGSATAANSGAAGAAPGGGGGGGGSSTLTAGATGGAGGAGRIIIWY